MRNEEKIKLAIRSLKAFLKGYEKSQNELLCYLLRETGCVDEVKGWLKALRWVMEETPDPAGMDIGTVQALEEEVAMMGKEANDE